MAIQLASDNFTRADANPIGTPWLPLFSDGGNHEYQISSNHALPNTADGTNASGDYYSGVTWPADQYSEVVASTLIGGNIYVGPCVRMPSNSAFTGYAVLFSNGANNAFMQRYSARGASVQLGTNFTVAQGDTVRLSVIGTTLTASVNGSVVLTVTDATYATGNPGIISFNSSSTFTNSLLSSWVGGSNVVPPAPASIAATSHAQGFTGNVTITGTNFSPDIPFSQTIVRDTFIRANSGTLGANWTSESDAVDTGVIGINSNSAVPTASGNNTASFWNANTFTANQYAECIVNGSGNGPNTHGGGPGTRMSSGNYYRMFLNINQVPAVPQLQKMVAGTFSGVGDGTPQGGPGSLARLESIGSVHTGYVDGVQVFQFTDADLATGAPGIIAYYGASTTLALNSWEGGDLLWTRQGVVIPTIGGGSQEPCVIYEANPQILTANGDGKIFKMWFMQGWATTDIYYAESNDGITWTEYGSNPVISDGANNPGHGSVSHIGGTYYGYFVTDINTNLTISRWTSANGVTGWIKTGVALSVGTTGLWDDGGIFNPTVWVESGTWKMMYEGKHTVAYSTGLATSPDGITWTKYASNPVMTSAGSADAGHTAPILIGNTYYYLAHGSATSDLPSDLYLWSSPDLINWTQSSKNPIYERVTADEGANVPSAGQVADPRLIEVNGTSYLFYDATAVQASGNFVIKLATAPYTIPQLLQGIFGVGTSVPATLSFSGTGVTVNSYSVQNNTTITANITIDPAAALTARDVVVTNSDSQTGTLAGAFTITSGAPIPISILPTTGTQGATFNITMTGTNFSTGTLSFSGTGITVNSYSVQTSTHITANISVNIAAATTARDVTVTNADTQTGVLVGGFTVLLFGYSISGSLGAAGAGATVTLSGDASASTTADGSGNYSFVGLNPGNYSVTVSKVGVAFSPTSQPVVIVGSNVTGVNFYTFKPRRGGIIIGTNLGTKIIK